MIVAPATREQFEQVKEWLRTNEGLDPGAGDVGQLQKDGVRAEFQYDGQTLRIELTHKPFFVSWDLLESKVKDGLRLHGLTPA